MSHIVTCPHCSQHLRVSEQITVKTLICPRCLADMDNTHPRSQIQGASINTDVKRDVSVGTIVLAVLIGLCVLGVVVAVSHIHDPFDVLVLWLVSSAALAGLLIIAIMRGMVRWGRSGDKAPIVAGVLGITFIIVALVLVTVMAVFLFFFFTCKQILAPITGGH